jgi:hypothetical protein
MKRFRNHSLLRLALFSATLMGFALATVMSVSPDVHEWFHEDAGHAQHECLATVLHAGGCEDAAPAMVVEAFRSSVTTQIDGMSLQWVESYCLRSLPQERAPPALS